MQVENIIKPTIKQIMSSNMFVFVLCAMCVYIVFECWTLFFRFVGECVFLPCEKKKCEHNRVLQNRLYKQNKMKHLVIIYYGNSCNDVNNVIIIDICFEPCIYYNVVTTQTWLIYYCIIHWNWFDIMWTGRSLPKIENKFLRFL